MARITFTTLMAAALTAACSYVSPPIHLDGRGVEIQALAGEWSGDYSVDGAFARQGSIWFKLVAGEDHAHGDVLMIPQGFNQPYERYHGQADMPGTRVPRPAEGLTIRFVRVGDGVVSGMLEPYWDPDRECQAETTFRGQLTERNTITGTFRSTYSKAVLPTIGRWRVTRLAGR